MQQLMQQYLASKTLRDGVPTGRRTESGIFQQPGANFIEQNWAENQLEAINIAWQFGW